MPYEHLCRACFDGVYPISLPEIVGNAQVVGTTDASVPIGTASSRSLPPAPVRG